MKLLTIHNRYLQRGGEDESREAEDRLLNSHGHTIVEYIADNKSIQRLYSIEVGLRSIWNQSHYRHIRAMIREVSPDIVDVHNFFPLISPAVYYAARAEHKPVIQTLHNYRIVCPGATFFREGRVCEDCAGRFLPWPALVHGCYHKDRKITSAVAATMAVHWKIGTWTNRVNLYIALTQFSKKKFVEAGLPPDKIVIKPHFVPNDTGLGNGDGEYFVFIGRLSPEKGLDTLMSAWRALKIRSSLKIVGDGPLRREVAEFASCTPGVEWLGVKNQAELFTIIGRARALIVTSRWYETFCRVIIEAYSKGTPVIASDIGALAELIEDGRTGALFSAGNQEHLAATIERFANSDLAVMRSEARREYELKYTPNVNYRLMLDIYERAIDASRRGD